MRKLKIVLLLFVGMGCYQAQKIQQTTINYVALGDSYTCCTGAKSEEAWPLLLANHLKEKGISIELTANPAHNAWTTQNLIDYELPLLEKIKPDFVTLLIGVNDWVQGIDSSTYHTNLDTIIDRVERKLTNKKNLLLITIPDFGVTPTGAMYSNGRDISKGIAEFNSIIKKEAEARKLYCVDIYPETQKMKDSTELIAADGLHPSAKEYAKWEAIILPVATNCLK